MISCTSTQEMAQSCPPSDQNLFQNLRILGLIHIGERLLLTSPCGITSQSPGMHCTYWSSKHKWACLRIRAITAEKASWSTLSCMWDKNTFPPTTNWRTNSVLLQSVQKAVEYKGMFLLFLFFDAFSLLSTDLKLQRMKVKHKLTTFFGLYSLSLKLLQKCIQNFAYFHSVYPILIILCSIHSSILKHAFFFTINFQLKSA